MLLSRRPVGKRAAILGGYTTTNNLIPSGGTPLDASVMDVAVFAGQSNDLGFNSGAVTYTPDANVMAFDGTNLVTYVPNSVTGREWGIQTVGNWATELEYSRQFRLANPTRKILVFKWSAGGTQLYNSGDSGPTGGTWDWNPASTGEFFDLLGADLQTALSKVVALGLTPRIRLVWWLQGENDAQDSAMASAYQTNLTALVAAMKDPTRSWKIPDTSNIVIAQIGDRATNNSTAFAATVRAAQAAVVAGDNTGRLKLFDTFGYERENGTSGVHLTGAAFLAIGQALWDLDNASQAPQGAPGNTVAPVISSVNLQVGGVVNATVGTWTNGPTSYTYDWQTASASTGPWTSTGVTTATKTLVSGDLAKYVRRVTTPVNAFGSGSAVPSNVLGPVAAAASGTTDTIVPHTVGIWGGVGENYSPPQSYFNSFAPYFGRRANIVVMNHDESSLAAFLSGHGWAMSQFPAQFTAVPGTIMVHALPCVYKNSPSFVRETFADYDTAHQNAITTFAQTWATQFPGRKLFVRPMWEFNNPGNFGWPWSVPGDNAQTGAQYVAVFQDAVTRMAAVLGRSNVVAILCAAEGEVYAENMYPGDAYVDAIGFDSYTYRRPAATSTFGFDEWDRAAGTMTQLFNSKRDRIYGFQWWADYAKTKGKPFVIPELACNTDEPEFITLFDSWFRGLTTTGGQPLGWFHAWWWSNQAYPGWFFNESNPSAYVYPNLAAEYNLRFQNTSNWS
jgi:hypothetical protein